METPTIPIKRHKAIVQFSREHHFGLLLCWKIQQGLKNSIDPQRISDYVLFFFDKDLKTHFAEEERALFSRLDDADELKQQALKEHAAIYSLVEEIRINQSSPALLTIFADTLEKHIRFEERILFNHIQNSLSETDLEMLSKEHPDKLTDIDALWDDHFWLKK